MAASENLSELSRAFGEQWAEETIQPRVKTMCTHKNYLHRTTAIYAMQVVIKSLSVNSIERWIVPIVIQMTTDVIPNVRFVAIRTLQAVALAIISSRGNNINNSPVSEQIHSALSKLLLDTDRDVKFYAATVSSI